MISPRDPAIQFAVPVNTETGRPLTEGQQQHLAWLSEAETALLNAMHSGEGTIPPGEHQEHIFQTRRMIIAAQHVETAGMFARKAILENT